MSRNLFNPLYKIFTTLLIALDEGLRCGDFVAIDHGKIDGTAPSLSTYSDGFHSIFSGSEDREVMVDDADKTIAKRQWTTQKRQQFECPRIRMLK